jgi:hypothetical protein
LVKDETQFITLEDFWQKGKLATGLEWFPKGSDKVIGYGRTSVVQKVREWITSCGNILRQILIGSVLPIQYMISNHVHVL